MPGSCPSSLGSAPVAAFVLAPCCQSVRRPWLASLVHPARRVGSFVRRRPAVPFRFVPPAAFAPAPVQLCSSAGSSVRACWSSLAGRFLRGGFVPLLPWCRPSRSRLPPCRFVRRPWPRCCVVRPPVGGVRLRCGRSGSSVLFSALSTACRERVSHEPRPRRLDFPPLSPCAL